MNALLHIAEFRAALAGYHLSAAAQKTLNQTKLVLLVAPSASGRNTIINELLKTGQYHFIVSDTTRQSRINNGAPEQNGREYWFRTEEEMLDELQRGEFLEAEIIHGQQVSGISIRELEKANRAHKIAITDVDIGGISNILHTKPDTVAILVLPPDFNEWQRRMRRRGDMPTDEHARRMQTATRIFEAALTDDRLKIVVNDDLADAVAHIDALARQHTIDPAHQAYGKHIAEQLFKQTQAIL